MDLECRDWDSRFFGYPVGVARLAAGADLETELRQARRQALELGLRLLYVETPPLDAGQRQACRQAGAAPVAINVEYAKTVAANRSIDPDPAPALCRDYHPALRALVLQSGHHSRFRLDPGFRNGEFERLYDEWLAASLRGDDGKMVLVAGSASMPQGLITIEPGTDFRIGLLAVDARWRGQGIGHRLVAAAERRCSAHARTELRVVTQEANQSACRFYERCGFRRVAVKEMFHAWFPPAEKPEASP